MAGGGHYQGRSRGKAGGREAGEMAGSEAEMGAWRRCREEGMSGRAGRQGERQRWEKGGSDGEQRGKEG